MLSHKWVITFLELTSKNDSPSSVFFLIKLNTLIQNFKRARYKDTHLLHPKFLAFFRELTASVPWMIVQISGFIGNKFNSESGSATAAVLEGMTSLEVACFGWRRRFVIPSSNAFVFTSDRENKLKKQANQQNKLCHVDRMMSAETHWQNTELGRKHTPCTLDHAKTNFSTCIQRAPMCTLLGGVFFLLSGVGMGANNESARPWFQNSRHRKILARDFMLGLPLTCALVDVHQTAGLNRRNIIYRNIRICVGKNLSFP